MGLKLLVAPADEPITLAEAKAYCRVDGTDDDAIITVLIVAARRLAEHATGRAFVTQQWELTLEAFPATAIDLLKPPLASVQSVKYVDGDGVPQTLATGAYIVQTSTLLGLVSPAYDTSWPATRAVPDAVTVAFTAGYGEAADVPQEIKQWMLLQIGHWYAHRESVNVGNIVNEMPYVDALLDPYRVICI